MHSARGMGERYSLQVSELSGLPGALHVCDGHYCTLMPGERPGYDLAEGAETPLPRAGQPGALQQLREECDVYVPGGIDVPQGWVDLVREFVLRSQTVASAQDEGLDVAKLTTITASADGQLVFAWTGEPTPCQQGRVAFAQAMARHIDPVSGAIGPVDDKGIPHWKREA